MATAAETPAGMRDAELMRRYTDFLDADDGRGALSARVRAMVDLVPHGIAEAGDVTTPRRLLVSVDKLRAFDAAMARGLLAQPVEQIPVFERAMQEVIAGQRQDLAKSAKRLSEFRIGLEGSFGGRTVNPRGLGARLVGGVVAVEGIVTRATGIRPRLVLSVHYCPATGQFTERTYRDASSVSALGGADGGGTGGMPTSDQDGNPLEMEYGKCWYRDFQRVTVQEMPESSPAGQLPRSVEVFFEGDLCDACKPGDRVRVVGVYRALGGGGGGGGSGVFKTVVVGNNVVNLNGTTGSDHGGIIPMHDKDIKNIRDLAAKGGAFERLSRSVAPSICGHEYIKKALLLLLVGGKEHNLANGTHLRGDINILMCGDPSTAKSQLLRFVLHTAPLALSTTGRGSSGVGLTAAVTTDQDTNERHLEAGAMVLADRGVVCIDEFDKMSDEDRVAIHEVMEQQTVTIAKAGIHASLNARCSVVAAANPVYGSYDKRRKPHENIALPDSLLSRFDLLFIVLDSSDADRDRLIADHVLKGHRFRRASHTLDEVDDGNTVGRAVTGSGGAYGVNAADGGTPVGPVPMFETAATSLYASQAVDTGRVGGSAGGRRSARQAAAAANANKILSTDFLKRYINYAKTRIEPSLSSEASEYISESYSALRQDVDSSKTLPITARCLETLIRLATAHAKCRLDRQHVTREDAEVAVELLRFALFNQAEPDQSEKAFKRAARKAAKKAAKKKKLSGGSEDTDSDNDDNDDDEDDEDATGTSGEPNTGTTEDSEEENDVDVDAEDGTATRIRENGAKGTSPSAGVRRGRSSAKKRPQRPLPESAEAEGGEKDEMHEEDGAPPADTTPPATKHVPVGKKELRRVMAAVNSARGRRGMLQLDEVVTWLAEEEELEDEDAEPLTRAQIDAGLTEMAAKDMIVISDGTIFIAA